MTAKNRDHRRSGPRSARRVFLLLAGRLPVVAILVAALLALPFETAAQDAARSQSMTSAIAWLQGMQADDGGFPGFSGESDPGTTTDVLIALGAARAAGYEVDPQAALDFLAGHALVVAQTGPGSAAKLALALTAAGQDPHNFASVNPISIVATAAKQGAIGFGPYDHALGLLALAGAGEPIPDVAIAYVAQSQSEDGGFAFDGSTASGGADTNTTALMVQAIRAAGIENDEVLNRALDYLLATRVEDGGFPYQPGGPADANSTALALQALVAAGDVYGETADSTLEALLGFQNENGSFSWLLDPRDDNLFSTAQAIPAVAMLTLPIVATATSDGSPTPEASPVALRQAA